MNAITLVSCVIKNDIKLGYWVYDVQDITVLQLRMHLQTDNLILYWPEKLLILVDFSFN